MSQKRALAQEIRLGSPDRFSSKRVGSGDETRSEEGGRVLGLRMRLGKFL